MDSLEYLKDHRAIVCRLCAADVAPRNLAIHLWAHHRHTHDNLRTRPVTERWVKYSFLPSLSSIPLDPCDAPVVLPSPDSKPPPLLKIHRGFGCSYCDYVRKNESQTRQHYIVSHAPVHRSRGGSKANATDLLRKRLDREHYGKQPPCSPVTCQRFSNLVGTANPCFRVKRRAEGNLESEEPPSRRPVQGAERDTLISNQVVAELADLESAQAVDDDLATKHQAKTQVSPWLERTLLTHYFDK